MCGLVQKTSHQVLDSRPEAVPLTTSSFGTETPSLARESGSRLANSTRPLPIARNQSVTVTSDVLSRAETGSTNDAANFACMQVEE
jgi:hypothetical protein